MELEKGHKRRDARGNLEASNEFREASHSAGSTEGIWSGSRRFEGAK